MVVDGLKRLTELVSVSVELGGTSKRQFAQRVKLSESQLHHLLMGRRMPTLRQAVILSDVLSIDTKSWVTVDGKMVQRVTKENKKGKKHGKQRISPTKRSVAQQRARGKKTKPKLRADGWAD